MQRGILETAELFLSVLPSAPWFYHLSARGKQDNRHSLRNSLQGTRRGLWCQFYTSLGLVLMGKCDQNSYFGISFLWCRYSRGKRFYSRWITPLRKVLAVSQNTSCVGQHSAGTAEIKEGQMWQGHINAMLRSWSYLQHDVGKREHSTLKCILPKCLVQHKVPHLVSLTRQWGEKLFTFLEAQGSHLFQVSLGGRVALYKILPLFD